MGISYLCDMLMGMPRCILHGASLMAGSVCLATSYDVGLLIDDVVFPYQEVDHDHAVDEARGTIET